MEDELRIRKGLTGLLLCYPNCTVVGSAKDGKEGLDMILKEKPDLVFTDIKMPVMDGLEMIRIMREKGYESHVVVLTGYAEFDYAQKALQYGVDEYLLKPISVEDVNGITNKIYKRVMEETLKIATTPEEMLRSILEGEMESINKLHTLIQLQFEDRERDNLHYYLICGLHEGESKEAGRMVEALERWNTEGIYLIFAYSSDERELFVILAANQERDADIERIWSRFEHNCKISFPKEKGIWIYDSVDDLSHLKKKGDEIRASYIYEMVSPHDRLIPLQELTEQKLPDYAYPLGMEIKLKKQICSGNKESAEVWMKDFLDSFNKEKYDPNSVKYAFIRMAGFVISLIEEVYPDRRREVMELDTIRQMGRADTFQQLCRLLQEEFAIIYQNKNENNIRNYTVLKAISYIREHYAERISLEEVAGQLNISSEYLSTLFRREIGINFSNFVSEFRISQAKRMLRGSEAKIYEVSERVGFTDTKYFNKVFKDIVGVSPKEYREK